MLDYAAPILALLLDWIAKGFVVLGLAFLADLLLRRANASLRHLIWLVGLAAVMLLPVVSRMLPSLDVPLLHLDFLAANPASEAGSAQVGSEVGFGWSTSEILLGIYVAGALLVFAWQLIGRAYAFRLRKRAGKITHGQLTRELQRLKAALGIHNPVDLLSSDLISIPFSTGYLRPVIVLPQSTSSWPAPLMESVLIHELAHIKRKDILTRIAAQISCCIHWINPLAWYGLGRIMMEQEIACDNLVLGTGTKASDYARNLLALSEVRRGRMDFALTALGRRTELRSRLLEILKPTRNRAPLRIGGSLVFLLLTFGLLLPVSALNIWDVSDAGMLLKPLAGVNQNQEKLAPPQTAGHPQLPKSSVKPLPDVEEVKAGLSQKIKDMEAQGVSQEEIAKFTMAAKAKIQNLQLQKMKQAEEEKKKQMELMKSQQGKKIE
jgi:beta-lactamase regulating signal transducer with metallopeptidase domain